VAATTNGLAGPRMVAARGGASTGAITLHLVAAAAGVASSLAYGAGGT
jgi:hypothetical protein